MLMNFSIYTVKKVSIVFSTGGVDYAGSAETTEVTCSYSVMHSLVPTTSFCIVSGVGAKKSRDDDWIEQQLSFDALLADLNQDGGGLCIITLYVHV